MLEALRWIGPSLVPALLVLAVVYFSDKNREPVWLVLVTFALGGAGKALTAFAEAWAAKWTALDVQVAIAGNRGAVVFLFLFVAPVREVAKVAAQWPAFRSKHFDEPLDGVVYSSAAALGFACIENALTLREHTGWIWIARTLVALPAHVFFAATWGYALGRAKKVKRPGAIFPAAFIVATLAHGLYAHLVYGRGSGALVGTVPLLLAMMVVAFFAVRDLEGRADRSDRASNLLERVSSVYGVSGPPSLKTVREALRGDGQRITFRWVFFGALVTVGAMTAGFAASVAIGHYFQIPFDKVDEHDVSTTGYVAILGVGVLAAFPLSGYLIAKASSLPTLIEPALASGLAIMFVLVLLGIAAPVALVFALAFSPIAWGLACAGAFVGRPAR